MLKELFSIIFRYIGNCIRLTRKVFLVLFVFFAVISLFSFFINKNKLPNGDIIAQYQKHRIYSQIDTLSQDTSENGKIKMILYQSSMCSMIGEGCSANPEDTANNFDDSLFGTITSWMTIPYANPPASGIAWMHNSLQDIGFVPQTYAATGIGFASIQGYMDIWKLFRDLSYLLLVLVMIAIGFMIMFRVNLGGATVGIEAALPRIVIAMIMITFSFPIAGFLIDIMYTLIILSVGLLYDVGIQQNMIYTQKESLNNYLTAGFWQIWPEGSGNFLSVGSSLWNILPNSIRGIFAGIIVVPWAITVANVTVLPTEKMNSLFKGMSLAGFSPGNLTGLPAAILFTVVLGLLMIWGPGLLFGLIILLTVMLFMFRIFFLLLGSYIKIMLYIIFAPIILMFSAIPGNGSIGWWLRNLFGELLTFPTIVIISLVGNAIVAANLGGESGIMHVLNPTMIGADDQFFRLPFLYGFAPEEFNTVVALGIVLLTPDFVKMVKGWVGVTDTGLNFGIGTFFAGAAIFGGAFGMASGFDNMRNTLLGYDPSKPRKGLLSPLGLDKKLQNVPILGSLLQP